MHHANIGHHKEKHKFNYISWPGYAEKYDIASSMCSYMFEFKTEQARIRSVEKEIERLKRVKRMKTNFRRTNSILKQYANYKFKTTNIRGKQYVEVNERIKFFRQEDRYKDWTIMSEFTVLDSEQCVCKTTIADATGRVIATGHAHEVQGASNINKTSYVENCETSAIGRALAMLGIGIDTSIASANEVTDAIAKQESKHGEENQAGTREARHGAACKHHGQSRCLHQVADRQEESIPVHHGQV